MTSTKKPHGSEKDLDAQRTDAGPQYGGEEWKVADERGDQRFGHARNDEADPQAAEQSEATAPEVESSGQQAGVKRGEKPRKTKSREA
jgi:hypothetical protein